MGPFTFAHGGNSIQTNLSSEGVCRPQSGVDGPGEARPAGPGASRCSTALPLGSVSAALAWFPGGSVSPHMGEVAPRSPALGSEQLRSSLPREERAQFSHGRNLVGPRAVAPSVPLGSCGHLSQRGLVTHGNCADPSRWGRRGCGRHMSTTLAAGIAVTTPAALARAVASAPRLTRRRLIVPVTRRRTRSQRQRGSSVDTQLMSDSPAHTLQLLRGASPG